MDPAAEDRTSTGNAAVEDRLRADIGDGARQFDVPPIDRCVETGQNLGLQDEADRVGGRGFGLEIFVAANDRIVIEEPVCIGDLTVLRRGHSGQGALHFRRRGSSAGARIAKKRGGLRRSEKLLSIRRTVRSLPARAKPQPSDGCKIECQFVGFAGGTASRVPVPGFAKSSFEGEALHHFVGDQRNARLAEDLFCVD